MVTTRKETLEMRKRKPLALAGIGLTAITLFLLTPVFLLALAGRGSARSLPRRRMRSSPSNGSAPTWTTTSVNASSP